jgi:hypothetical protein
MRYLVPFFLMILFAASAILSSSHLLYRILFAAQVGCYACAGLGLVLERMGIRSRLLAFPQYFALTNLASVIALYKLMRGERYARWEPIR